MQAKTKIMQQPQENYLISKKKKNKNFKRGLSNTSLFACFVYNSIVFT
jgi:hypothetical protein